MTEPNSQAPSPEPSVLEVIPRSKSMRRLKLVLALVAIFTFLLGPEANAQAGDDQLFDAARVGDVAAIRTVAEAGADLDAVDTNGFTALMYAAAFGQLEATHALVSLGAALEKGAAPESDWAGATALMAAVEGFQYVTFEALLDSGANPNARTPDGDTPLMLAAGQGRPAFARLLIERGAVVNAQTRDGLTALMYATVAGHADLVLELIEASATVNTVGPSGNSLHFAAEMGNVEVGRMLLQHGADHSSRNQYGQSPLMIAALGGFQAFVEVLLTAGADPNAVDNDLDTPLGFYAAASGHDAIARALVDAGAEVNAMSSDGMTPLDYAESNGHAAVASFLEESGGARAAGIKTPLRNLLPTAADIGPDVVVADEAGSESSHYRMFGSSGLEFDLGGSRLVALTILVQRFESTAQAGATIELVDSMDDRTAADLVVSDTEKNGGFTVDESSVERTPDLSLGDASVGRVVGMETGFGDFDLVTLSWTRGGVVTAVQSFGTMGEVHLEDALDVARALDGRVMAMEESSTDPLFEPVVAIDPAALASIDRAGDLVRSGRVDEAIEAHEAAREIDPGLEYSAQTLNTLCWYGSIWGAPERVLEYCERAVTTGDGAPYIRDSRGVALALTGELDRAIEDFEAWVEDSLRGEDRDLRVGWIETLRRGENPLTSAVLEELRAPETEAAELERALADRGLGAHALPYAADLGLGPEVETRDDFDSFPGAVGTVVRSFDPRDELVLFTLGASQAVNVEVRATLFESADAAEESVESLFATDVDELAALLFEIDEDLALEVDLSVEIDERPIEVDELGDSAFSLAGTGHLAMIEFRFEVFIFSVGAVESHVTVLGAKDDEGLRAEALKAAVATRDRLREGFRDH